MIDSDTALVPPWWIFHVPHDSVTIPRSVRDQFTLSKELLDEEILRMTDHHTFDLFAADLPAHQVVRCPVSRLVVDVERFELDELEPMADRGMGVIYRVTHDLRPLRRDLTDIERSNLLDDWYRPHHAALTAKVEQALESYGRALVIDAHSFPATGLPYESDHNATRPEICIGTDPFHTPAGLIEPLQRALEMQGLMTALNTPFAGALVPMKHYKKDARVAALMIEVRRDVYMNEDTGLRHDTFEVIRNTIRSVLLSSLSPAI
jgi:N-formylglutamate amidohydrolase